MNTDLCYSHDGASSVERAHTTAHQTPMTWFFATKINGERPKGAPPS